MDSNQLYLSKVIEAADLIEEFLVGADREKFMRSDLIRGAILYNLTIIGQAASRVDPEFQAEMVEFEWDELISLRDLALNVDFSVDWSHIWTIVTKRVSEMRNQIIGLMKVKYPEAI